MLTGILMRTCAQPVVLGLCPKMKNHPLRGWIFISLMKEMERRGFSHIPVISDNKVAGVFSMSTVFLYLVKTPECDFKKLTFYDIKDEIGIHSHVTEGFIFLKENETVRGARRVCEEYDKKHLRIGLMLLTKTGNENEALRGIVTPWDILSSSD